MYSEAQGCEDPHEASLSPGNLKKCRNITVFGRDFTCSTVQDHRIPYFRDQPSSMCKLSVTQSRCDGKCKAILSMIEGTNARESKEKHDSQTDGVHGYRPYEVRRRPMRKKRGQIFSILRECAGIRYSARPKKPHKVGQPRVASDPSPACAPSNNG